MRHWIRPCFFNHLTCKWPCPILGTLHRAIPTIGAPVYIMRTMRLRQMNNYTGRRTYELVERSRTTGLGVGLNMPNNGKNSISANEKGNGASKVGVADTSRPPRRSKTHSIERESMPVLPTVVAQARHTTPSILYWLLMTLIININIIVKRIN